MKMEYTCICTHKYVQVGTQMTHMVQAEVMGGGWKGFLSPFP